MMIRILTAIVVMATGRLYALEAGTFDMSGTFSQGYVDSENNNFIQDSEDGTFDFREYGVSSIWKPFKKTQIGAQVFGREYGTVGNDVVYLDWASVDYRFADRAGLRVGLLKVPSGLYNETRELDALRTEVLLPGAVYPELTRELVRNVLGVGLYGDLNTAKSGTFSYYFLAGEQRLDEENGELATIFEEVNFQINDYESGETYAARLGWATPVPGLEFGSTYSHASLLIDGDYDYGLAQALAAGADDETLAASSLLAPVTIDIDSLEYLVLSVEYARGDLLLVGEWTQVLTESATVAPVLGINSESTSALEGAYAKAGYRWTDWLDTAIGYATIENLDREGDASGQDDVYVSLRFDLTDNLIVKLEEHFISGNYGLLAFENPDGYTDDMTVFLAKATLYF